MTVAKFFLLAKFLLNEVKICAGRFPDRLKLFVLISRYSVLVYMYQEKHVSYMKKSNLNVVYFLRKNNFEQFQLGIVLSDHISQDVACFYNCKFYFLLLLLFRMGSNYNFFGREGGY